VGMDNAIDILIALVYLAMDEAFCISLRRVGIYRCCVTDVVFFEILST
jgi:hypothetical protein